MQHRLRNNGCQCLSVSSLKKCFYGVRRKIADSWTHADHCKESCLPLPKHKRKIIPPASERNWEELKRKMQTDAAALLFFRRRISQPKRFQANSLWKFIKLCQWQSRYMLFFHDLGASCSESWHCWASQTAVSVTCWLVDMISGSKVI